MRGTGESQTPERMPSDDAGIFFEDLMMTEVVPICATPTSVRDRDSVIATEIAEVKAAIQMIKLRVRVMSACLESFRSRIDASAP